MTLMAIKIVTDSSSDIPRDLARELDISIVPLYVRFGAVMYRDGVDIEPAQFYEKLQHEPDHPATSSASPGDFAEMYEKLGRDSDGIVSIHVSSKLSATYEAALRGKQLVSDNKFPIEVVDSRLVTIALGLVAIAAAKAAAAGRGMQDTLDQIHQVIPAIRTYGMLDTLKYIARGGRFGKAGPLLGSVLPVRPLLTIKDGTLAPVGVSRTRVNGIERLLELVRSVPGIQKIGISHSSVDDEIVAFVDKLKSFMPDVVPIVTKLGPALGAHGGPGTILVAMQQEAGKAGVESEAGHRKLGNLPSMQSIKDSILQRKQKDVAPYLSYELPPAAVI